MVARRRTLLSLVAALALAAALLAALAGTHEALLAVPGLLVVLPLLRGRYVGEQAIARLAAAVGRRARPRRPATPLFRPRRALVGTARGGRLIAAGLARRGPPAPALG